ncbi:glycosyltransferase family 8 protein [Sinorhizobium meliloti]|uniref:glycosyltransferase family 8 protein n=1 Tax=Rhizobium meliloti TaxID=382 RepID=UPI000FD24674|nr:glycosyltransferase family 8 protein [Sinorhizobium meliloti]RVE90176.1 glycosyltransferase family 8 protein [Sinorhizobium meliloti]RVH15470.1 glycosyltransferase family 8 protein [Sinorhizobium meliloti]RVH42350.1 glycosyltransferase family 8 protein [Sinorhizobium meliloti]
MDKGAVFPSNWQSSSGSAAIVLVTDQNYALPTFSAALSADQHTKGADTAIRMFVVGAEDTWARQFDEAVAGTKIKVIAARLPQLAELSPYHRDHYLPPIALARFWIDSLLDDGVDRFLYIDGDTMVDGELDSLLASTPPAEGLMAAPDFLNIFMDEVSRGKKRDLAHLEGIGCRPETYFNSGVIYASRKAWNDIVPVAMKFMVEHPEHCPASDQSALNHAVRGRVTMLSLRYNYQSEHMMVLDPRRRGIGPAIWHFTGGPKPWNTPGWPWDESFNRYYCAAEMRLHGSTIVTPVPPEAQTRAGIAHRRRSRSRMTWVYPWRKITRRRKILHLLADDR